MPLFILGLIVLICLLIYAIISYISGGRDDDTPTVHRGHKEDDSEPSDESNTLFFPTENIETEKHKRNIH